MELDAAERRCCVVSVSESGSGQRPVSCSGVLLHPQTGTVVCTGLPFSRFLADSELLSGPRSFLAAPRFSSQTDIRVFLRGAAPVGAPAELLMLVRCLEFHKTLREVFREADQWSFHGNEDETRDAQVLSWFAVLRVGGELEDRSSGPDSELLSWRSSSSLRKGCPVVACGSPFGSLCPDLFLGTLSRGIVSNLAGEDNAVILTDARCLPGTEGGGLFAATGGHLSLVGVIVSPFGWKASEWIGLTLVCSVQAILRSVLLCVGDPRDPLRDLRLLAAQTGLRCSGGPSESNLTVCLVDSGSVWGSGVLVAPRLTLTCRHVVNGKSPVTLKFHHIDRFHDVVGDVLFSTKRSSPYDLALVRLRDSAPEVRVPQMAQSFHPGEDVTVVGYGGLGRNCGPSLTGGVLSKAISWDSNPVMLQTTCAVQAGTSGGAVVRRQTGELLGVVSSNTRDFAAKVTYPHLNFSIPATVFQGLLQHFNQTQDPEVFKALDTTEEGVRRVWRLQGARSKL
ncbi:peroxisomal leader peptide-processing protease [Genypterus blacodes]|uniref:peroxisomal leader peptide-processing protease n=1 Tax=Genypterus blacodes TaxID=154954 RepID=UPI003F757565